MLIEYQLRIRDAANAADALVVTSVAGGTNPYLAEGAPTGDGETVDPRTGDTTFGSYSGEIVDPEIGSMQRLVTSQLEDAGGRPQLGYRIAILEFRIDGGSWAALLNGLLTTLQRTETGTWRYTVGDPLHAQKVTRLFSPSSDTLITDFLDAWPRRGCVLGGPIIGATQADAFNLTDKGGWQMRVETTGIATEYFLRPVHIYGPPNWREPDDQLAVEQIAGAINEAVGTMLQLDGGINGAASPWDTIRDTQTNAWAWPGLTLLIDGVPWKPLVFSYDTSVDAQGYGVVQGRLVGYGYRGDAGLRIKSDGVKTLTNGQLVRVRALTILPSEISPIYLCGHPIDLLKQGWDATGIPYSSTECDAVAELIGTDASYALRITAPQDLASMAADVCRVFGIGLRTNDDGEIEPFDARLGRSITDPVATITADDVVDGSVRAYELEATDAIRTVQFQGKAFRDQRVVPQHRGDTAIVDGVAVQDDELLVLDDDTGAAPYGDFTLSYQGMIRSGGGGATPTDFRIAIARRIFDRWGHGGLGAEMTLLRGGVGDSIQQGQEVFVDLPQLPNHNYLLGDNGAIAARAMQVKQLTKRAIGYDVKLVDSGASRQPPATVPTLSIAASSDRPRTVAEVTITNAATLNAAGYGARLQVAFTDDGSDASATQFTDVQAWGPGKIPTGAIRLPPARAGLTVQARARSELPQARGTNWSTSHKITLDGIDPPTGVSATPDAGDGSRCLLAWTPGSATDLADIWLRLDGETFDQAVRVADLEPGSIQFELEGLVPSTDYIASVQHRDPATQDLSDPVDASFTTSSSGITLDPPTDPAPFAVSSPTGRLLGATGRTSARYGLAVVAAEVPGVVEIAEAVETAPGAGTYGSYVTVGRVDSVSGNWTIWQSAAPNDGLRRKLKARHVGDGVTASSYTSDVVATPWTYQALAAYPGSALTTTRAIVTALYVSAVDYSTDEVTVAFTYDGDLGTGTFTVYRIATAGAVADLSGAPSNIGTTSGASPTSIVDSVPDDIISTAGPKVTYSYQVRTYDGLGTLLRATEWLSVTYSHA